MTDNIEVVIGVIMFNIFYSINFTEEIVHFLFSLAGSVLSACIVFVIKKFAENNWDKWFNKKKK